MAGLGSVFSFGGGERMTIGIQSNNLANQIGIVGAGAPTLNTPAEAPQQVQQQQQADTWLSPDLKYAPTVNWNDFEVGPINWEQNLHGAYDKPQTVMQYVQPVSTGMAAYAQTSLPGSKDKPKVKISDGLFGMDTHAYVPTSGITGAQFIGVGPMNLGNQFRGVAPRQQVVAPITFKDANLQRYLEGIDTTVYDGAFGNINDPKAKLDHNKANIAALSGRVGTDEQIKAMAEKYGVDITEVQNVYDRYNKARQAIIDPVGANWADIKNSPFYQDFLAGTRGFINHTPSQAEKLKLLQQATKGDITNTASAPAATYNLGKKVNFDKLNALAPNSPLNAEYFGLHSLRDLTGRNTYRLTDAADFGGSEEDYAKFKDTLNNHYDKGGQFNYRREFIKAGGERPKGYDWRPSGMSKDGYNEALNISQNFLGFGTNGEKNYKDVGYKDKRATEALFEKKKVKNGFLGGLKPIAAVASFIPGPWQIPARVALAMDSAASGNPIGAIASAVSFLPGANGVGLNPIAAGASKFTGGLTQAFGDLGGKAISGATMGALQGALSGNIGKGAFLGALSPTIAAGAQEVGFSPSVSNAIGTGVTGVGNLAYNYSKIKRLQQAALEKQRAQAAARG